LGGDAVGDRAALREGRKRFFLKKEAKTFAILAYAVPHRGRQNRKSFVVLFFKKELLT
jgi:hypothetical protein